MLDNFLMLKNTFLMLAENMKERVIESKTANVVYHIFAYI